MGRKNKGLSKDKSRYTLKRVHSKEGIPIPSLWKGINKYYVRVSVIKDDKIVQKYQPLKALVLEEAIKESQKIKDHWAVERNRFKTSIVFEITKTLSSLKQAVSDIILIDSENPERKSFPDIKSLNDYKYSDFHGYSVFSEKDALRVQVKDGKLVFFGITLEQPKEKITIAEDFQLLQRYIRTFYEFFFNTDVDVKIDNSHVIVLFHIYSGINASLQRIKAWCEMLTQYPKPQKGAVLVQKVSPYFVYAETDVSDDEINTAKQLFEKLTQMDPLIEKLSSGLCELDVLLGEANILTSKTRNS